MTRRVNALKCRVIQEPVDDDDSRNLERDGVYTRRLENESRFVSKITAQKRVDEPLNVFARVGNVADRIERIGCIGAGALCGFSCA
jgi:hypothetical protein